MSDFTRQLCNFIVILPVAVAMSGCLSQEDSNAGLTPGDPQASNSPPVISGSPPTSVEIGAMYSFTPNASDPDGDTLNFSIGNKPLWASFNENTGELSGQPTLGSEGDYAAIRITVSDGQANSSLPDFSLRVSNNSTPDPDPDPTPTPDPGPPPLASSYPGVPEFPFRDQLPDVGDPADVTSCRSVNGTADDWAVVTVNTNDRCEISGSYFVLQNSTINHRLNISGGPYVVRNNDINSPGTGGAVNPSGSDILIEGNVIRDNGTIPSSADHHGINVGGNTSRLWILSNSIYHNSGDAVQFCHSCVGGTHNGPAYVYIAGNIMHDDEENAIDLKEFLGPVVAVCNEMYGYESGQFSGNGEAVRINDEGQQGEAWFAHNMYHDNRTDVATYNSDAEGYFLDESASRVNNNDNDNSIFMNGSAAQQYYDQYQALYGLDLSAGCSQ
jgi:hypothetical protein